MIGAHQIGKRILKTARMSATEDRRLGQDMADLRLYNYPKGLRPFKCMYSKNSSVASRLVIDLHAFEKQTFERTTHGAQNFYAPV